MAQSYPYTVDYSGRQVDIEMLQSIVRPVEIEQVTVSSITQPAKIVTGVQKLVQRYALLLLSTLETVHFDQDQGTLLVSNLVGGVIQNRGRLQSAFAVANTSVFQQMKKDDAQVEVFGDQPADEILTRATLLDFDIDFVDSLVYLRIRLTTQAGDDLTFIVPTTAPR